MYVVSLSRSPSETQDEFRFFFLINFEQLINYIIANNLLFVLITGDFNVRSTYRWKNDLSTSEDCLWSNSYSSKFIFLYWSNLYKPAELGNWEWSSSILKPQMSPSNYIRETQSQSRVSSFVRAFNLGLCRYYINADTTSINRVIDIFDWGNSFGGKSVHEQVHFFNKTILNIFHIYIPNKIFFVMIEIHRGLKMQLEKY